MKIHTLLRNNYKINLTDKADTELFLMRFVEILRNCAVLISNKFITEIIAHKKTFDIVSY